MKKLLPLINNRLSILCLFLIGITYNSVADIYPQNNLGSQKIESVVTQTKNIFPKQSAQIYYKGLVPANMTFSREGEKYTITATLSVPARNIVLRSEGIIKGNQFKPTKYTDTRGGVLYASAEFDYQNKTIRSGRISETRQEEKMGENALDVLSVAWQLALNEGKVPDSMQITTGKGKIKNYTKAEITFEEINYNFGEEKLNVHKFNIPAKRKMYYGLATNFGYFPASISFDGYELYVERFTLDGMSYRDTNNSPKKTK